MAFACLGLALSEGDSIVVKDAECCAVSFPKFYEVMQKINATFTTV
jgi:3-phosphoshikimate 1-carboxyvinyltransferase